jgi:hypothetical protein
MFSIPLRSANTQFFASADWDRSREIADIQGKNLSSYIDIAQFRYRPLVRFTLSPIKLRGAS